MTRLLAAAAAFVSLAAFVVTARTADHPLRPGARPPEPTANPTASRSPTRRSARATVGDAERVATAYALAARSWSSRTQLASWQRERNLTGGRYRRALKRARPTQAQLDEMQAERASSIAIPAAAARTRIVGARAWVDVALHERATAGGQSVTSRTHNRVWLRRAAAGWRVTGWTILPGGDR